MKNRAAYMVGLNKMEIRETPVPEPKAGEVLVKIEYVGICGSDVHYFKDGRCGDFVVDGELMLGHEAGGVVEKLGEEEAVAMLEINVSCPNVSHGGIAFGQNPDCLYDIAKQIKAKAKQPIIMKLSPNVTDITEMAKAAEAAGSDALSLINTITGMKIDIHKRTFALANKTGGLSGPAIKPVAVRMVYQVAQAVKLPIIGMGGIANAEDAIEFMLAGATGVAVGAMNFVNPYTTQEVVKGIEDYMERYKVENLSELIGAVK